jgi:hypothetical protein
MFSIAASYIPTGLFFCATAWLAHSAAIGQITPASAGASPTSSGASVDSVPAWAGQRADEPIDVKAFLTSRAELRDNTAPLYLSALRLICGDLADPADAPLEAEIAQLADVEKLAAGTIAPQQIDDVLTRAAVAVDLIDTAQRKPKCVFVTGLRADSVMPHLVALQTVSRLAVLQLRQAETTGDFKQTETAVQRSLRISSDIQPRGPVVGQLVSMAIEQKTLDSIQRLTLADSRLTVAQVDRLMELLQTHQRQVSERVQEGLKVEFICSRNCIEDLQTGRLTLDEIVELLGGASKSSREPVSPGPAKLNYEAEIAACNNLYQLAMAAATTPVAGPINLTEFRQELDRHKAKIDAFQLLVASTPPAERTKLFGRAPAFTIGIWVSSVEPLIQANCRTAAHLAATQMLLALRRYEIVHSRMPNSLQTAAAETILKTVPTDPFDGQPLRWTIVAGTPTVYSVGQDGKDDRGEADWDFGRQPGDYRFVLPPPTH